MPQLWAQKIYVDAIGDIDPGLSTGNGTLDIVKLELSNTSTDILFKLTVNGNLSTTDWGKFMIGISSGSIFPTTNTGNGWGRPIQLNSTDGGMDFWCGTWVDGGGGSQLWQYNGSWNLNSPLSEFSITPGAQSIINMKVTSASIGLNAGDDFYFDVYSSGGGATDGAVDALSNPAVTITSWSQPYTSSPTSALSFYKFAAITFTGGSGYTHEGVPGSINQPFGRFYLDDLNEGSTLTGATIKLNGTRTGVSNFKLWASSDNIDFDPLTSTQIGTTVAVDPGEGNNIVFSSLSKALSYYNWFFVTCDLAENATGAIQGVLVDNSSLTIAGGSLSSTITNATLSGGATPLPVELTSLNATIRNGLVDLKWETATEVSNYGFEVERKSEASDWIKIGFVEGHGSTNSPKFYTYSEKPVGTGNIAYRLKQIDNDGQFEYSPEVEVLVDDLPNGFALEQNYPNPFNPATSIRFALKEDTKATLKVYNSLGSEVATLFDGTAETGRYYDVKFGGGDLASGFYIYKLDAGEYVSVKKMLLMK
ncbi:MAG: T9SS type A sorting domain-containing protein [Bacteroidetes bacterium]|nr:T9SS type A sorting domain-containing protein [Bacteroidota bacterium]